MIYQELLKEKYLNSDFIKMITYIDTWKNIYKGSASWLDYQYPALTGTLQKRKRKALNMGKLVCNDMSNLVWSERPVINTDTDIEVILNNSNFFKKMTDFTERFLALGGACLKLYVKDDKIYTDFIPAERFIPISYNNKGIFEADFLDMRVKENKSYVRVESHRKVKDGYSITNKIYQIEAGKIKEVSLAVFDDTLQSETLVKTTLPLFSYIRNISDNNLVDDSPLGVSIYGNCIDTLQSLDIAFDALSQEIVLGRKRIIVPSTAVRKVTDDDGNTVRYFDPSDEIFQAFGVNEKEELKITDNSVELRIEELKLAVQVLLNILSFQIGHNAGYLSFDGISVKTATEIISENSKTFKTKQNIENNIGQGIVEIMNSIRELGKLYGYRFSTNEYTITWQDSVIEDRNTKTEYWTKRYNAGTCTLSDVLINVDGLSEEEAAQKAELIKKDSATFDINNMFGGVENKN